MENNNFKLESFFQQIEIYFETKFELYELHFINASINMLEKVISGVVIFLLLLISFIIGSIGLSIWLGEYFGNSYIGYLFVALCYFLGAVIIHFSKFKLLTKSMRLLIVNKFRTDDDEVGSKINELKATHELQKRVLKSEIEAIYFSIQPVNLIKNALHNLSVPLKVEQEGILKNLLSIGVGFVSKKLFMWKSTNSFRSIIGTIIEVKLANYLSKKLESNTEETVE